MKTHHIGGRIGDTIFALWTMRQLGGGRLIVSDFHKGNWSLSIARTVKRFLNAQWYVEDCEILPYAVRGHIDYDLHDAENDYNPEAFPDLIGPWPGNANIAQRYALHFGLQFDGIPWLTCPTDTACDVAFHCPIRRSERTMEDWVEIVKGLAGNGLNVAVLGDEPPLGNSALPDGWDIMDSAAYINGAKCFLGTVSSMNAIAEGLGIKRFVEHAPDCWNVTPDVILNGVSNEEVIVMVTGWCR